MKYFTKKNLKSLAGPLALVAILGSFTFTMASINALNLKTSEPQMAQVRNATEYLKAESSRKSVYLQEDALKIKESIQINTMLKKAPSGNLLLPPNPTPSSAPVIGSFLVNGSTTPTAVDYEDIFTATWSVSNAIYCEGRGYHIPRQNGGDWIDGSQYPATGSFTDLIAKEGAQNGYSPSLPLTLYCVSNTGDSSYQTIFLPVNEPEDEIFLLGGQAQTVVNGVAQGIAGVDSWKSQDMTNWSSYQSLWGYTADRVVIFDDEIWVFYPSEIRKSADGVSWNTVTSSPSYVSSPYTIYFHNVEAWNGALWSITGSMVSSSGANQLSNVSKSTDGINWTQMPIPPWIGGFDHDSFVFDNKLWVIQGNTNVASYVQGIWNTSDGINWTNVTNSLPWGFRINMGIVVHDGYIYVTGGRIIHPTTEYKNDVWRSSDGVNWVQVTQNAQWSPREHHRIVSYNNKMWLFSGLQFPFVNAPVLPNNGQLWSSIDGATWNPETFPMPLDRQIHEVIVRQIKEIVPY